MSNDDRRLEFQRLEQQQQSTRLDQQVQNQRDEISRQESRRALEADFQKKESSNRCVNNDGPGIMGGLCVACHAAMRAAEAKDGNSTPNPWEDWQTLFEISPKPDENPRLEPETYPTSAWDEFLPVNSRDVSLLVSAGEELGTIEGVFASSEAPRERPLNTVETAVTNEEVSDSSQRSSEWLREVMGAWATENKAARSSEFPEDLSPKALGVSGRDESSRDWLRATLHSTGTAKEAGTPRSFPDEVSTGVEADLRKKESSNRCVNNDGPATMGGLCAACFANMRAAEAKNDILPDPDPTSWDLPQCSPDVVPPAPEWEPPWLEAGPPPNRFPSSPELGGNREEVGRESATLQAAQDSSGWISNFNQMQSQQIEQDNLRAKRAEADADRRTAILKELLDRVARGQLDYITDTEITAAIEQINSKSVVLEVKAPKNPPGESVRPADRDTGTAVLGNYPAYVWLRDAAAARGFQLPDDVYDRMSVAERRAANEKVLDLMIARGDRIILATHIDDVRPGSDLVWEIEYFQARGYAVGENGNELMPPS